MRSHSVLLQLSDSALPTGAFSHSFGLEQYISRGEVTDEATFAAWLKSYVDSQLTCTDALLIRLLYAGEDELELAELASASAIPAQVRSAGAAMAKRTRAIAEDALGLAPSSALLAHPAIEFAKAARAHGVEVDVAVLAHLTASVTSMTQNAVRGIPIGQSAGQRVIAGAHAWIEGAVAASQTLDIRDLGAVAPGLDIAQMQHERLRARMFMS